MPYKIKKRLSKLFTALASILIIAIVFTLQFVIINHDFEFYRNVSFWLDLCLMLTLVFIADGVYWRDGTFRGHNDEKYINSAIDYSVRVNRIKENSLTEDFYDYIDYKNKELFIEERNKLLDSYGISKEDYYCGCILHNGELTKAHCEMVMGELKKLKKLDFNGKLIPYYKAKQRKIIIKASTGDFNRETLSATEILSDAKMDTSKYGTSYNAKENRRKFVAKNIISMTLSALLCAFFSPELADNWTLAALFTFVYRIFVIAVRAFTSDAAGFNDIAQDKKTVNLNRVNLLIMYATTRNNEYIFKDVNIEINKVKELNYGIITPEVKNSGN